MLSIMITLLILASFIEVLTYTENRDKLGTNMETKVKIVKRLSGSRRKWSYTNQTSGPKNIKPIERKLYRKKRGKTKKRKGGHPREELKFDYTCECGIAKSQVLDVGLCDQMNAYALFRTYCDSIISLL